MWCLLYSVYYLQRLRISVESILIAHVYCARLLQVPQQLFMRVMNLLEDYNKSHFYSCRFFQRFTYEKRIYYGQ